VTRAAASTDGWARGAAEDPGGAGQTRRVEVTENALQGIAATAAPHPLLDAIPSALSPWLLPFEWDREKLWAIQHPLVEVAVDDLRWLYDLPFWRGHDGRWFAVSPRQFLTQPEQHPEHVRRIEAADLSYPIHVIRRRNRLFVLDGVHRVVRADLEGLDKITAVALATEGIQRIVKPARRPLS
jgi:hypothetical protein